MEAFEQEEMEGIGKHKEQILKMETKVFCNLKFSGWEIVVMVTGVPSHCLYHVDLILTRVTTCNLQLTELPWHSQLSFLFQLSDVAKETESYNQQLVMINKSLDQLRSGIETLFTKVQTHLNTSSVDFRGAPS